MTSERRISSDILAETINVFNELMIQSTINDSEEYDAESNPNINPKVATYTPNRNYPNKLFINRIIPEITPGAIPPIDQTITEEDAGTGEILKLRQTILLKDIVTDAAHSGARISQNSWGHKQDGQGRHHTRV